MRRTRYARLPTEQSNPQTRDLDRLSAAGIAKLMSSAERRSVQAVARAAPEIGRAIELIAASLARGGRLIFVGAGTSGRLGVLEAAECPPTFDTPARMVQAIIAGGRRAVFRSAEGAEDDARDGARQVRRRVRAGDVVVGITASGVTPFVQGALLEARRRRAATVFVTCNPDVPRRAARVVVRLAVGPEVLAGSTRLKAGTATKLTLNALTTGAFTRLGRVYGNRMVDLRPRSAKLRARALRLVADIGRVTEREAMRLLEGAGGNAKVAIAMARLGVDARSARQRLRERGGSLRRVIEVARGERRPWTRATVRKRATRSRRGT